MRWTTVSESCFAERSKKPRAGAAAPALTILTTIYCVCDLSYQPHEPFQIVLSVCTVDFDTPNLFAAARTVVLFSMMYTARSQARSSKLCRTHTTPLRGVKSAARSLGHVYVRGRAV